MIDASPTHRLNRFLTTVFRRLMLQLFIAGLLPGLLLISGCQQDKPNVAEAPVAQTSLGETPSAPEVMITETATRQSDAPRAQDFHPAGLRFVESASNFGLNFTYQNGARGNLLMVESIGGGAGWLDIDQDELPDVYFAQGGIPNTSNADERPMDSLFRQLAGGKFIDVTLGSGTGDQSYSQGVAIGDYDEDGFDDIFVTNVGQNRLYCNVGDGTFLDCTNALPPIDPRWSSSAAWADLDQDGFLDLYVCNYLQYDPLHPLECLKDGLPALCHPRQIPAWPDECYRSLGTGRFERVTDAWGLKVGRGIATADADGDGDLDAIIVHQNAPAALLVNESARGHWLHLRFTGIRSNRRGIGCKVTVRSKNHSSVAQMVAGTSFASSHQPVLVFGLGTESELVEIEVRWPSGIIQVLHNVTVDQILRIKELIP